MALDYRFSNKCKWEMLSGSRSNYGKVIVMGDQPSGIARIFELDLEEDVSFVLAD